MKTSIGQWVDWGKLAVFALVGATIWCVKLEMNNATLTSEFTQYKRDMKQTTKEMDNAIDDLTHRIIILETVNALCKMR